MRARRRCPPGSAQCGRASPAEPSRPGYPPSHAPLLARSTIRQHPAVRTYVVLLIHAMCPSLLPDLRAHAEGGGVPLVFVYHQGFRLDCCFGSRGLGGAHTQPLPQLPWRCLLALRYKAPYNTIQTLVIIITGRVTSIVNFRSY